MTNNLGILREEAEALRLEDVRTHLVLDGWHRDAAASWETATVYHREDAELVVPVRRELRDYALRMADIVQTLASVHSRSPRSILSELMQPPSADVLRLRDVSPYSTQGSVPIEEGLRLINGGRNALLAVAHSAKEPLDYHPRLGVKDAVDFLDKCRLGQTERGSYIATILIPVPPEINETQQETMFGSEPDQPYERRVTTLFMSALDTIRKSLDDTAPGELLDASKRGISSNLCDAVAEMLPNADQSEVEISVAWARTRQNYPKQVPARVTVASAEAGTIRAVAQKLRERQSKSPQTVQGAIIGLSGDTTSMFDGFVGTVRIHSPQYDHQVTVKLGRPDFQLALDAYREGKRIKVTGYVRRMGKTIELLQPKGFSLISD